MDSVLRLPPLLSKALDTLCLQISVNRPDENSLALIDILEWRINSQISAEQFSQLYTNWLESKKISSLLAVRQEDTYPKTSLVNKLPQSFLSYKQVIKSLEVLNDQYNKEFLKCRSSPKTLEILESVFSYLDWEGVIHLRFSQILFLYMALAPKQQAMTSETVFKMELLTFRKNLGQIQGRVLLRVFKSFLSTLPESMLAALPNNFSKIQARLNITDHLPDIFAQGLTNWYSSNNFKFQFKEGIQKLELYRRILEEYDYLFFNVADPEKIFLDLELAYGYQQLGVYEISLDMVREVHKCVHVVVNKYISWFLSHNQPPPLERRLQGSMRVSPRKMNSSVSRGKILSHRSSIQKLSRSVQLYPKASAPQRVLAQYTTRMSTRSPPECHILQDMNIFKGRKIQSFQTVMRRLKKKK